MTWYNTWLEVLVQLVAQPKAPVQLAAKPEVPG
jgi:hypothetical protein